MSSQEEYLKSLIAVFDNRKSTSASKRKEAWLEFDNYVTKNKLEYNEKIIVGPKGGNLASVYKRKKGEIIREGLLDTIAEDDEEKVPSTPASGSRVNKRLIDVLTPPTPMPTKRGNIDSEFKMQDIVVPTNTSEYHKKKERKPGFLLTGTEEYILDRHYNDPDGLAEILEKGYYQTASGSKHPLDQDFGGVLQKRYNELMKHKGRTRLDQDKAMEVLRKAEIQSLQNAQQPFYVPETIRDIEPEFYSDVGSRDIRYLGWNYPDYKNPVENIKRSQDKFAMRAANKLPPQKKIGLSSQRYETINNKDFNNLGFRDVLAPGIPQVMNAQKPSPYIPSNWNQISNQGVAKNWDGDDISKYIFG